VTWTGAPGAHITATHIVGSDGAIVLDPTAPGRATVSGRFEPFSGWCTVPLPDDDRNPVASLVTALRDGTSLPAGVSDACRNLDVCLTFYEAAREGCTKQVSP
jgi:predicted dehydrogenase